MSPEQELFQIEEGFWLADATHFLDHLDVNCLLAFPQAGQMHGVYVREYVARTVSTAPGRWKDLAISDRQILQPTSEVAIVSYRADVLRADGQPYAALVSSGYVRRADGWKLMFHQHSPV